jgi:hypothetical protein
VSQINVLTYAIKNRDLVESLLVQLILESDGIAWPSALTLHDILHQNSSCASGLKRDIRLDRFMTGKPIKTPCTMAIHHPIVILVTARKLYYAMIIDMLQPHGYILLSLDLTDYEMHHLSSTPGINSLARGRIKTKHRHLNLFDGQVITMWHKIVKPVLDGLGLKVSKN